MRTYAVYVSNDDLETITELVREGIFASRSEFVRAAIRDLLRKELRQTDHDSNSSVT
ncbi:MAG: ribbon-helix-helix domain-containing protein [Candidatus Thorarchaeota archaeon]